MTIKRGAQIAYIPMHAEGDREHPHVEYGFVTSVREGLAFCRYWRKGCIGELRTVAGSECTYLVDIVRHVSISQQRVDATLERIEAPNAN